MFGIDQLTRIHPLTCVGCPRHLRHDSPPLDTLSGNHTELAVHPRMDSRSEQRASYYVKPSIAFHLSCNTIDCYACFVFIVSSPHFYCPVVSTIAVVAPVIDYVVDDRTPYSRATRQAEPLPLSHISPTVLYLSIALGIYCCYVTILFYCIAYHCRPLITFRYPMLPYIIYYSNGPCALLFIG